MKQELNGLDNKGMIRQVLPDADGKSTFDDDQTELLDCLVRQGVDPSRYCQSFKSFNPYPIAVLKEEYATLARLQKVLHRAIVGIVTSFLDDPRLTALYNLSDEAMELLTAVNDNP